MSLAAWFIAASFLSFLIGTGMTPLIKAISRWGKALFVVVHPGHREVSLVYARPKGAYKKFGDGKKDGVAMPYEPAFRHTYGNRAAFLVDRKTGSPLVLTETASLEGIDGRSWLKKIFDTRVQQVQASGALDLVAMARYGLIALVIIGIFVIATFGVGLKIMQG